MELTRTIKISEDRYRKSYRTEEAFLRDYSAVAVDYFARRVESSIPSFFAVEYQRKQPERVYFVGVN